MARVIPAQLSFLAIYSPALGGSEETFRESLVFYYSKDATPRRRSDRASGDQDKQRREDENERLRHIGLAQGIVNFAGNFSNGEPVDSIDTEKSRLVLHELEQGWWILASIDLTRLPTNTATSGSKTNESNDSNVTIEYSAREVSPPALLIQHLIQAHSIFLLHHGSSLSDLYAKQSRPEFCTYLDKFWSRFASNWDVLLHGSPAVDIFNGLKLAAGGELGIGVGEEEWGSGEREVLEDFARRTDGLVDLMVARYGEPSPDQSVGSKAPKTAGAPNRPSNEPLIEPWMGGGRHPEAADGIVFSGVGTVSRSSLRTLAHWMDWIYTYGEHTYGVKDSPTSGRRKRRRRHGRDRMNSAKSSGSLPHTGPVRYTPDVQQGDHPSPQSPSPPPPKLRKGIPPPLVTAIEESLERASKGVEQPAADSDTWMNYLTLGYGSTWGPKKSQNERVASQEDEPQSHSEEQSLQYLDPEPEVDRIEDRIKAKIQQENNGSFIIGLKGDLEVEDKTTSLDQQDDDEDWNSRILLRTLYIELSQSESAKYAERRPTAEDVEDPNLLDSIKRYTRLRVVVYVNRPFIYTFLFHPTTGTLSLSSFYTNLHNYLSPLHRPLSASTSPNRVASRIAAASNPYTTAPITPTSGPNSQPIYDLVFDPQTLTVHSSIPNIPTPGTLAAEGLAIAELGKRKDDMIQTGWSRMDALSVHSQILTTVSTTRSRSDEVENTCKTGRGWWIVWMRLPPSELETTTSGPVPPPDIPEEEEEEGLGQGQRQEAEQKQEQEQEQEQPEITSTISVIIDDTTINDRPRLGTGFDTSTEQDDKGGDKESSQASVLSYPTSDLREAFLVRRARDAVQPGGPGSKTGTRNTSSLWRFGAASTEQKMGGSAAGWGPRGLGEGIGIDPRRYIEGLLSLNR